MPETDEELLRQAAAGNVDAFEQIVERHQASVYGMICRFCPDRAEAEDLAQDVFVRLYESAATFAGRARFTTWLYRIATNLCLNHVRRKKPVLSASLERVTSAGSAPHARLLKSEANAMIRMAIESLSPRQRLAVILHRFDGLSYKQIAEVMECPLASVESLIHRSYVALRARLAPYFQMR